MSKTFRSFTCDRFAKLRCSAKDNGRKVTSGVPEPSKPITIIVDLRSEHNLEVLLEVERADSATNMQVIGLTHRPTGLSGMPTGRTPGSGGGRGSDGRAHATRAARRYADRTRTISHQDPERSPSSRPEKCRRGARDIGRDADQPPGFWKGLTHRAP